MNLYPQRGPVRVPATALFAIAAVLLFSSAVAAPPSITGTPVTVAIPTTSAPVTINLRELGVIAGSAPLVIDSASLNVLVNGTAERLLPVALFPNNGPGRICITISNIDFTAQPQDTIELQLAISNLSGGETAGPAIVRVTNTPGSVVDTPAEENACNDPNTAPVANAGPDRAVADTDGQPGEDVTLDGSLSSDADAGSILSYEWFEGDVSLGAASVSPTLTVNLAAGVHDIRLLVIDDSEDPQTETSSDAVQITVNGPQAPVVDAGAAQTLNDTDGEPGEPVTLTGTASDPDGSIASVEWRRDDVVIGTTLTLETTLPDGANDLLLTVTDNSGLTAADTVTIVVNAAQAPTADAGADQLVEDSDLAPGEEVTLTGTATDPDGEIAIFEWLLGQSSLGTGATLTANLPDGVNVVTLLVTDDAGNTASDTVQVTINAAPEASVLSELPNLTPNQQKVALAVDRVCADLSGKARGGQSLTQDQQQLLERCDALLFNNSVANQIQALDELVADDFAAARTQTLLFANTQYASIMDRLMALRGGARGLSLAGLNIIVDGKSIPLAQLQDMAKDLLGGGASADEAGGLLSDKWGLWARGNYSFGDKDASSSSPSFEANQWSLVGGVDYRLSDKAVIGAAFAYGDSSIEFDPSGEGSLDTASWAGSLYGSVYAARNFYFDGIVNVANSSYDAQRNITYVDGGGLVDVDARGDTDGLTISGGLSGGYDFLIGGLTVSPNLGFFYIDTTIDSFTEQGAGGLDLIYDEQKFESLTGNLGLRMTYAWNLSWGVLLPHLRVDYVREFENDVDVFGVRFAADPNAAGAPPILVETDNPDQSYWRLAAGFSAQFKYGVSGYIEYQRLQSFEFISFQDVSVGLRMQKSF